MRLEDELKAIGCSEDWETFEKVLGDTFTQGNRNCIVEDLLSRWREAKSFCVAIRRRYHLGITADEFILRRLLNMRKDEKLEKVGRRGWKPLSAMLEELGIDVNPDTFRDLVSNTFRSLYRGRVTVDGILTRWADAGHFCQVVRGHFDIPESPPVDSLILRTLTNLRRDSAFAPEKSKTRRKLTDRFSSPLPGQGDLSFDNQDQS